MDGNGRWAKKRGLPRKAGHKVGAETFRTYRDLLQGYRREVSYRLRVLYRKLEALAGRGRYALMNLFRRLSEGGERRPCSSAALPCAFWAIWRARRRLSRAQIAEADEIADAATARLPATASLCINYGGRDEIKNARPRDRAAGAGTAKCSRRSITEETHRRATFTPAHMPDPDLIIRPSGEIRTSNFLLWQSAYAGVLLSRTCCGRTSMNERAETRRFRQLSAAGTAAFGGVITTRRLPLSASITVTGDRIRRC